MRRPLYLALLLGATAILSTLVIILGHNLTKETIEENALNRLNNTMGLVYQESTFEEINVSSEHQELKGVYKAINNSEIIGYIFKINVQGRNGVIEMLVAINPNSNSVHDIKFLKISETKGIGSKVTEQSFIDQFKTLDADSIDIISGATISSTAVKNAVNISVMTYESVVK